MFSVTATRVAMLAASGFESEHDAADAILQMVQALGSNVLKQHSLSNEQTRRIRQALNDLPLTYRVFERMIERLDVPPEHKSNFRFMLIKLMDDLISLGFHAGQNGGGRNITPSVLMGAKQGGLRSGEARRKKREDTWEPHARELAQQIRAKNPTASQDTVATEIGFQWKNGGVAPPQHGTLKSLVSKMEKSGDLPRRTRP